MKEKEKEEEREEEAERERERSAMFKEPRQWLKSLLPLHLDTHKYKAQPFELTRRE